MQTVLLHSKTTVPSVAIGTIKRGRLEVLLQQSNTKVTIVRAPAGYGKTTMLSQWVSQRDNLVAWLSIDATDNDPIRFWKYLIQTVSDVVQSEMAVRLLPLFNSQPQFPIEMLIDSFLNEIGAVQERIHIVIDDYHLIENQMIHEMMTRFIDYLPGNTHVYIASRTDLSLPVAKWRVKAWLTEINMEELRFTAEEVERFYKKKNFVFKDADLLQHVMKKTEGWAAGIQLLGLSIATIPRDEWNVNLFEGSHSFISDFLLKEILATLPQSTQDFLVLTSILNQLEPAVCDALTNRLDSEEVLTELEKRGLFIVRLHTGISIFRYHHLFTEALQAELRKRYSQEAMSSIYKEAATILYDKGDFTSAIELALNGQSYACAEGWIHAHIVEIFGSGQTSTFIRWVQKLLKNNCPVHPETLVMYAFTLALLGKWAPANQVIEGLARRHEIDKWMDQADYEIVARGWVTVKVYVLFVSGGDIEEAIQLIREKLKGGLVSSKWDGIPVQYNRVEPKLLRTSIGSMGKLWPDEKALPFYELFRNTAYKEQNMTGFSYGLRAETLYERNFVDEALLELEEALRYGHHFQDPGLFIPMYLLKSRIYAKREQFATAHALLDYAAESVKEWHWQSALYAMKARYYLRENDVLQAEKALYQSTSFNIQQSESGQEFWLLVHARILLAKGQAEDALKTIIQVKEKALKEGQVSTIVESAVLEAVCQMDLSNEEAALIVLHEALKWGNRYGYIRTFLDEADIPFLLKKYLKKRKRAMNVHWGAVSLSYVERLSEGVKGDFKRNTVMNTLTPRERDVLLLLASGASNIEIASRLGLTEGTVRFYLTKIYRKIGVNSRTQAVLLAKEWEE